ncbi:putative spindle assembly checkpoint component MAD1 (Mitotic arrest deficient protein 1) [Schistosoma mansoni]|uniref:putative spindle assembly checkpoint component MAD1 (Mitotic arrest deficient protein 1) n=1 Tax=Schistosoma mansoni TaxID=6183 RepID=UPI0001A6318B|nr:putative spindle assembly checkpoint component MAD1 (Mitotic arrest deficient protein 1) [Schistosoma mansoni]|eukprot:XP_018653699.1 putative spindle assembly checkpoint component MAD1 (Mitotic arrest deficient protein 1) [Schistosoma mansoni]
MKNKYLSRLMKIFHLIPKTKTDLDQNESRSNDLHRISFIYPLNKEGSIEDDRNENDRDDDHFIPKTKTDLDQNESFSNDLYRISSIHSLNIEESIEDDRDDDHFIPKTKTDLDQNESRSNDLYRISSIHSLNIEESIEDDRDDDHFIPKTKTDLDQNESFSNDLYRISSIHPLNKKGSIEDHDDRDHQTTLNHLTTKNKPEIKLRNHDITQLSNQNIKIDNHYDAHDDDKKKKKKTKLNEVPIGNLKNSTTYQQYTTDINKKSIKESSNKNKLKQKMELKNNKNKKSNSCHSNKDQDHLNQKITKKLDTTKKDFIHETNKISTNINDPTHNHIDHIQTEINTIEILDPIKSIDDPMMNGSKEPINNNKSVPLNNHLETKNIEETTVDAIQNDNEDKKLEAAINMEHDKHIAADDNNDHGNIHSISKDNVTKTDPEYKVIPISNVDHKKEIHPIQKCIQLHNRLHNHSSIHHRCIKSYPYSRWNNTLSRFKQLYPNPLKHPRQCCHSNYYKQNYFNKSQFFDLKRIIRSLEKDLKYRLPSRDRFSLNVNHRNGSCKCTTDSFVPSKEYDYSMNQDHFSNIPSNTIQQSQMNTIPSPMNRQSWYHPSMIPMISQPRLIIRQIPIPVYQYIPQCTTSNQSIHSYPLTIMNPYGNTTIPPSIHYGLPYY